MTLGVCLKSIHLNVYRGKVVVHPEVNHAVPKAIAMTGCLEFPLVAAGTVYKCT